MFRNVDIEKKLKPRAPLDNSAEGHQSNEHVEETTEKLNEELFVR